MRLTILALIAALLAPASALGQIDTAVSANLARLRQDLHLSDGQEAAWRRYAAAVSTDPQAAARRRAAMELLPTLPTPRRVALIEASMAQDAADFRRQGQAVLAFYAELTPEQQRTFDRDTLPTNDPAVLSR
jgi:hypothetical protein